MKVNLGLVVVHLQFELMVGRKYRVKQMFIYGGKIRAVKLYRELYGCGLRQAMEAVNVIEERRGTKAAL